MPTSEKALRYNEGKKKWSYVHFKSLEPMVDVLMFGAKKYAPFNWQKPMDTAEILESMMRHLTALLDGEINDPESGLPHMGHIQCNAMFFNYQIKQSMENLKFYCEEKAKLYPGLEEQIFEFYDLALAEIEDGGSKMHEISLCMDSVEELIENSNKDIRFSLDEL